MNVKVSLGIGYANCDREEVIEIDDADVEGKTEEEIEEIIRAHVDDWIWEYIETDWEII